VCRHAFEMHQLSWLPSALSISPVYAFLFVICRLQIFSMAGMQVGVWVGNILHGMGCSAELDADWPL